MKSKTIQNAVNDWLEIIRSSKSAKTYKSYKTAANAFLDSAGRDTVASDITEDHFSKLIMSLKWMKERTEKHYSTIIVLLFEYLSAKKISNINMDSIRFSRRNETRRVGRRLRKVDIESIDKVVKLLSSMSVNRKNPIFARARAFVLLLSSSGLRAFEALSLRFSDIDYGKLRGVIVGKGNKEARFIFDKTALRAILQYKAIRSDNSDFIFISYSDRNFGKPIDYDTARRDVSMICDLVLKEKPAYKITPHHFRHYFATMIKKATGDIEVSRELLRQENIQVTQGYLHNSEDEIDKVADKIRSLN